MDNVTKTRIVGAWPLCLAVLVLPALVQAQPRDNVRRIWQPTPRTHGTARDAARAMVSHFYQGLNARLSGDPVVNEGHATGAQRGYKVSIDGRTAVEAVMVKRVAEGWVGTYEIGKYHREGTPRITATRTLDPTYHDLMIVETTGPNTLHPRLNLDTVARSDFRTKHGIAVRPQSRLQPFPRPLPILPMTVMERRSALAGQTAQRDGHAMIWPGPSGDIQTRLEVQGPRATTTLDQTFHRFVIMRGGAGPQVATGTP